MTRPARLLIPLLCALAAMVPATASANGVAHRQAVRALAAAEGVFTEELSAGGGASREATGTLRDLAVALPALDGSQLRRGRALLRRPTDRGGESFGAEAAASPTCNANFCVHWSGQSENAPAPGFVDDVAASLDQSYAVENGTLGWKAAKPDGGTGSRHGIGGEGQVDVYITNLGQKLYGYAAPDAGQSGSRRFAYLVLDNDYVGFPSSPLDSLRVTVAHEYNHILQFNYDTFEDLWMFESTATWAEEQVYPEINDYLNYMPAFARRSRRPLTGTSIKVYAEAVWNHWLSGRYGVATVRDAWAASGQVRPKHLATAAYDAAIRTHGSAFAPEFGAFAAATAEWRTTSQFPDSASYPEMKRKGKLTRRRKKARLDNTSFRLLEVKPQGNSVSMKVRAPRGVASTIALVGREGATEGGIVATALRQLPRGGTARVTMRDPGRFSRITGVIANGDGSSKGFSSDGERRYRSDDATYRYVLK